MGLTDTEKEEVGGGIGGSVLLIIVGVVIVLYCWRRARTGYVVRFFYVDVLETSKTSSTNTQSVRNTLDEEERIDERKSSSGNFVEEIVADIDSLFDFSKAGESNNYEDNETTTIELENLSLLEDYNHHRKSSATSADSPRVEHLKRRRSSHDDNDATVSLQIRSDDDAINN